MGALRARIACVARGTVAQMTLDLLRFTTAGSVDDGKSTLIGRLLFDSKQVFEDQLEHVAQASERRGGAGALDLALLTDGLRAEREQGITIDVAYRYFATPARRFIIADCPGHQQYTRNMVTGASTADLAVVLVDARRGVLEQSKRHAFISALLGIPQMVVAINKMDLVDHSQERFEELVAEFEEFASGLDAIAGRHSGGTRGMAHACRRSPTSRSRRSTATTSSSARRRWPGTTDRRCWSSSSRSRSPTTTRTTARALPGAVGDPPGHGHRRGVDRDGTIGAAAAEPDYRGYAGQLASGALRRGDEVAVLPGGGRTRIAAIDTYDGELEEAMAPMSLTLRLEDELDISRGELICRPDEAATVARELEADVCWMTDAPLRAGGRYVLKHTSRTATAIVEADRGLVDVHTLRAHAAGGASSRSTTSAACTCARARRSRSTPTRATAAPAASS